MTRGVLPEDLQMSWWFNTADIIAKVRERHHVGICRIKMYWQEAEYPHPCLRRWEIRIV